MTFAATSRCFLNRYFRLLILVDDSVIMPSNSLIRWNTSRRDALDEIVMAHQSVGGSGPGRRVATQQIYHAYVVLLAAQFQGFCRALHSESIEHVARQIQPHSLRMTFRTMMTRSRKLDSGNANAGNIGADFGSFGFNVWDEVKLIDKRNQSRQNLLQDLNDWRNAVAHQEFSKVGGSPALQLQMVTRWRRACDQLAVTLDRILCRELFLLTGVSPW